MSSHLARERGAMSGKNVRTYDHSTVDGLPFGYRPELEDEAGEQKFTDTEQVATALSAVWAVYHPTDMGCLSAVAQGDGQSNFDGREYHITSYSMNGTFIFSALEAQSLSNGGKTYLVRCIIGVDTQTNGAEVVPADVVDTGSTNDLFAFRNLQTGNRFRILKDTLYKIQPRVTDESDGPNTYAWGNARCLLNFRHIFKKPLKVVTSGTTAVVANLPRNSLFLIAISNVNGVGSIEYRSRMRFLP